MTLERTEPPLHIPSPMPVLEPIQCDYIDVSKVDGDQPRYKFQPHSNGGKPIGPPLILEREGAQALIQHLENVLREPKVD